jgi:peptidoglycan/LPS O-acetylase OafA/YrhL
LQTLPLNKKLGYVASLDGLRAIAVILVMLVHAHFYLGINGQIGVSVFFTLSGFLITTLLLEEYHTYNRVSFIGFYIRRTMRLFPALYTLLLFVVCYVFLFKSAEEQQILFKEILSAAFYVNNISWSWGWGNHALLLGHTWSLAVEEQFYLIWPWIVVLMAKVRSLLLLQFALIIFIILSWYFKATNQYPLILGSIIQESIFIGCLGALLRWNYNISKIPTLLTLCSLIVILLIGILPIKLHFSFFNPTSILTMIIIFGIINQTESSFLNNFLSKKLMVFLGKISYSLYLWHVIIFKLFTWHSTLPPYMSFLAKFIVTFIMAIGSWFLIEKKGTTLGRKWSKTFQ